MKDFKLYALSVLTITGIQVLKFITEIQPVISFVIQTVIGILTIAYLIRKHIHFKHIQKHERNT